MDFLKNSPRFSFVYGGEPADLASALVNVQAKDGALVSEYVFPHGLKVTNVARKVDGAYDWVNWLENTGSEDTLLITELHDCDVRIPFEKDARPASRAFIADGVDTRVFSPKGSLWVDDEFCCETEMFPSSGQREAAIFPGDSKHYATTGGRSSQEKLPFFDINRLDDGVIFAIGWTGQWNCDLDRDDECIRIRTGLEDTSFVLHPGEKIRTSSMVMLPYHNGQTRAHNDFRRLVRDRYSLIGQPGRDTHGPLCVNLWGGLSSEQMVERVKFVQRENLGFEYVWVDAGWYGDSAIPCPNEFEGDWGNHTGDWQVNPHYHPDGMLDFVKAFEEAGLKFLLWFEPERVIPTTPIVSQHPEYFLRITDSDWSVLLDLGDEAAWNYCHGFLHDFIEKLHISCYRQDFNFDPLPYWRANDEENRKGIHEIKHIMGMYRLWDTLLAEFPGLIIDNCASGGRRIDIETVRRSLPLWRSDYQCPANADPDVAQNHTLGLAWWLPYHGTSIGRIMNDTYRARSSYTTALGNNFLFSAMEDEKTVDCATLDWIRGINEEYKRIRPLMDKDFYQLTSTTTDKQSWCGMQYHDPDSGEGLLLFYKREKSPYEAACFPLGGVAADKLYEFRDADSGEVFVKSGSELLDGMTVIIAGKRVSRLLTYKAL